MMDFFVSMLQKALEGFLSSLGSRLAEKLIFPGKNETRKKPSPRRRKLKG